MWLRQLCARARVRLGVCEKEGSGEFQGNETAMVAQPPTPNLFLCLLHTRLALQPLDLSEKGVT